MNSTLCRTLRKMLADGFEQYNGLIESGVYERLECPDPKKVYWVSDGIIYHCLGCNKRCTPKNLSGFQTVLPKPSISAVKHKERVAAILEKNFVRPDEAALCLEVSERQIYKWVQEGILIAHNRKPVRITVESVKAEIHPFSLRGGITDKPTGN